MIDLIKKFIVKVNDIQHIGNFLKINLDYRFNETIRNNTIWFTQDEWNEIKEQGYFL